MCAPHECSWQAASDSEDSDYPEDPDDSSSSEGETYPPQELAAIFLDFYKFLTTLHFDAGDLKIAPPEGWHSITQEACQGWKSSQAIEVLRRLPYFNEATCRARIHYKSILIDYTSMEPTNFSKVDYNEEGMEFWGGGDQVDPSYVVTISSGHETFGRALFLDVKHGLITEDLSRASTLPAEDVQTWFDDLKRAYRSLELIPCVERITIEADRVPERAADLPPIAEAEVCAQSEEWGTDLDIQYVRQLYRQHGWPDAFRCSDAKKAVDELMDFIGEKRGSWQWDSW